LAVVLLTNEHFDSFKVLIQEFKSSIHEDLLDKNKLDTLEKAINESKINFYIIVENNEIIGMCSISILFSTYKCESIGMFDDFYIKKAYRKKGFAKKLVDYVFNDMKVKGINSVLVGCSEIDIGMYNKLGFNMKVGHLFSWNGK
jgi:predicted acetyltransferase